MCYKQVIVIGYGKLFLECIQVLKKHFDKKIIVLEYEKSLLSSTKKFKEDKNIQFMRFYKKEELALFFEKISQKTLVISANNSYIFTEKQINEENLFIINFHNSILPKYRGRNAQMWAIFHGEKYAGATWHVVNKKLDDGDILIQKKIKIDSKMTSIKLTVLLINLGIEMFESIIDSLLTLSIETKKQKKIKYTTYMSKDLPNDGYLNTNDSLEEISIFLRAMDFGRFRIVPYPKIKIANEVHEIRNYELFKDSIKLFLENEKVYLIDKSGFNSV